MAGVFDGRARARVCVCVLVCVRAVRNKVIVCPKETDEIAAEP